MKKVIFVALVIFIAGCHRFTPASHNDIAKIELASVSALSPDGIASKNISSGEIIFYGIGSKFYGYEVPGLTEEEMQSYVNSKRVPVVIRFSDDPAPIGASKKYWDAVDGFLVKYNKLIVQYLTEHPPKKSQVERSNSSASNETPK